MDAHLKKKRAEKNGACYLMLGFNVMLFVTLFLIIASDIMSKGLDRSIPLSKATRLL